MKTPVLFVSHGSPMNAIAQNLYTQDLNSIGKQLQHIKSILVISAHWQTRGIAVTASSKLSTYHDFGGFPKELFDIEYPVDGALDLIPEIENMIAEPIFKDTKRGLDHGAWSMLIHLFPDGNIPVLQMSLDITKSFAEHFELAKKLLPLREKDVLILLSGNLTHNFSHADFHDINAKPIDWAIKFDEDVKNAILKNDSEFIIQIKTKSDIYKLNHPTDDHYLPIVYLMGLKQENDHVVFPHMSWQHATMSMRHILLN
jgi:4,5-DOPA dioxygenase extradiol